jgi:hypothetical protein
MHSVSLGSVCLALLCAGCAGDEATAKRIADVEREINKMRVANAALSDRLEALEEQGPAPTRSEQGAETESEPADDAVADERPTLAVVRLTPADEAAAAPVSSDDVVPAVEDDGMRPVIKGDARGVSRVDEPVKGRKP